MATEDRLEILSTALLEQHRDLVNELKQLAGVLRQEFGWHYLLDLVWIISALDLDQVDTALDAGAGVGVLQWYLASKGVDVLSVDRGSRAYLPILFRNHYRVEGMRSEDLASPLESLFGTLIQGGGVSQRVKAFGRGVISALQSKQIDPEVGTVTIYHQDLRTLTDVPDNSIDAVVAVSSLEHNMPDQLQVVVAELMRVLKPGGRLVASLATSGNEDRYHGPSAGWTYSETSMRRYFNLDSETETNYDQFPVLFEEIRNSAELRDGLAKFYFRTGQGGMPWGKWDPQYVPLGVVKVKPGAAV